MKKIHLIMPFSRRHLKDKLIQYYEPMDIIIHQIMYKSEKYIDFKRKWVKPCIISDKPSDKSINIGNHAVNCFIKDHEFTDNDYYIITPDDDMFNSDVFNKIKKMDNDIIVISMDRGKLTSYKQMLYAEQKYMRVGYVGAEQVFIKGKIFKELKYDDTDCCGDGVVIESLKEKYDFRYEPKLFVKFNYFNPKWWTEQK